MKILLVSDSHGRKDYLEYLINKRNYDYVFFAGDGLRDLGVNVYDDRVVYVRGNCDFFAHDEPRTQTIFIDGYKILITHGDYYKVKYGMQGLQSFAFEKGYNLVCFGHTHEKSLLKDKGITYVNPGSLRNSDYAEISIAKDKIDVIFKKIENYHSVFW